MLIFLLRYGSRPSGFWFRGRAIGGWTENKQERNTFLICINGTNVESIGQFVRIVSVISADGGTELNAVWCINSTKSVPVVLSKTWQCNYDIKLITMPTMAWTQLMSTSCDLSTMDWYNFKWAPHSGEISFNGFISRWKYWWIGPSLRKYDNCIVGYTMHGKLLYQHRRGKR